MNVPPITIDELLNISNNIVNEALPSRFRILLPFTMFYKIASGENILYIALYPGGIKQHIEPNMNTLHQHDHFELMYVLRGELTHLIENCSYHYKAGDACLMNRNISHTEIPGKDCAVVFLNFSDDYIRDLFELDVLAGNHTSHRSFEGKLPQFILSNLHGEERYARNYLEFTSTLQALSATEPRQAEELIDQMQQELINPKPGSSYLLKGLLSRLFYVLETPTQYHMNYVQLNSSNEDFLYARIKNYLQETSGRITRSELAAALNYNAEYLNQIIKKRSGLSLMQLAKTYTLDEAKRLLRETDVSISQLIQDLGFISSSHFYQFFQKETGMSPGDYRKQKVKS